MTNMASVVPTPDLKPNCPSEMLTMSLSRESTGKKVEVVRACDAKRGTLRRKEGNGNESTGEKEERKT